MEPTARRKVMGWAFLWLSGCATPTTTTLPPPPTPTTTTIAKKAVIHLCARPDANGDTVAWTDHTIPAVVRLQTQAYDDTGYSFDAEVTPIEECDSLVGQGCNAADGSVYCDARSVARVLRAIALTSASIEERVLEIDGRSTTALQLSLRPWAALQLTDASDRDGVDGLAGVAGRLFEEKLATPQQLTRTLVFARMIDDVDFLDAEQRRTFLARLPQEDLRQLFLSYAIYEHASTLALAYVFGHELAHGHGVCAIPDPSLSEMNGDAAAIFDVQRRSGTLCASPLSADEIAADECGLRAAHKFDGRLGAIRSRVRDLDRVRLILATFARQVAIDAVAQLHNLGMGSRTQETVLPGGMAEDGLPQYATVHAPTPGYLYAPLRTILFAAEMRSADSPSTVGVCDNTAQDVVLGLNAARHECADAERAKLKPLTALADVLEPWVPPGVARGWRTGRFDDRDFKSFRCESDPRFGTPAGQ